jgi:hypothetical protein
MSPVDIIGDLNSSHGTAAKLVEKAYEEWKKEGQMVRDSIIYKNEVHNRASIRQLCI